jgi:hypothetical protein
MQNSGYFSIPMQNLIGEDFLGELKDMLRSGLKDG